MNHEMPNFEQKKGRVDELLGRAKKEGEKAIALLLCAMSLVVGTPSETKGETKIGRIIINGVDVTNRIQIENPISDLEKRVGGKIKFVPKLGETLGEGMEETSPKEGENSGEDALRDALKGAEMNQ